jgi:hypothetical protein
VPCEDPTVDHRFEGTINYYGNTSHSTSPRGTLLPMN